jgi:ribosome modulation factor
MKPRTRNRAFLAAYNRGARDGKIGKTTHDCPYQDIRTDRGSVTFSRAFRGYWLAGWRDGFNERRRDGLGDENQATIFTDEL